MNAKQGQIWWVSNPRASGSEQSGRRPGLVLQNDSANEYLNTTIVAMISSSGTSDMPEQVCIGVEEGLKRTSHADLSQLFTISKSRLIQYIGKINSERWIDVEKAIERIFYKTI